MIYTKCVIFSVASNNFKEKALLLLLTMIIQYIHSNYVFIFLFWCWIQWSIFCGPVQISKGLFNIK